MKKILAIILLLAAVVAAVMVYQKWFGKNLDMPPGLATELAPADTMVFVEIPNVARTLERGKKNGLYVISQEPEWQEFIAKWDEFAAANSSSNEYLGLFEEIKKAAPAGLFLAVSKGLQPFPKLVGGLPFRGKKSAAESLVRQLKTKVLKAWPGAKSTLAKHGDIEIETITSETPLFPASFPVTPSVPLLPLPGAPSPAQIPQTFAPPGTPDWFGGPGFIPKFHLAFHANWLFFATDKDVLTGTLDRYLKKPGATPGLAKDALFQETLKHGNSEPDLTVWARWPELRSSLALAQSQIGIGLAITAGFVDPEFMGDSSNPIQALLFSWKLDGLVMRDRFYVHLTQPPKLEPSEHRSLALTPPNTAVYLELKSDHLVVQKAVDYLPLLGSVDIAPFPPGLYSADVITTFGPELMFSFNWPDGVFSRFTPDFVAAAEVRNPKNARDFAEIWAKKMGGVSVPADKLGHGAIARWTAAEPLAPPLGTYKLSLALTDRHVIFGVSAGAVDAALQQFATRAPNLATKPGSAYPAALQNVNAPDGGLLYVDTRLIFERIYGIAKPTIGMQLAGSPDLGKYFDAGKLPQDTTISQHLAPIVVSYGIEGPGWLVESTGTVSFSAVLVPAAAIYWALPAGLPLPP